MDKLKRILEAVLLASGEPVSIERMLDIFSGDLVDEQGERPDRAAVKAALDSLEQDYADHGVQLVAVASGYRFQTRADIAPWVNRLWEERPQRYSRALLETLAIIAYRQPITRGEIEDIRGVAVGGNIMKTLAEREWVRVVGHRDVPGRPAVYATTRQFLDYFNLGSLSDLPSLSELRDIDDINLDLFGNPMAVSGGSPTGEVAAFEAIGQDDEGLGGGAGAGDPDAVAWRRGQPALEAGTHGAGESAEDGDVEDGDASAGNGGARSHPGDPAANGEDGERRMPHAARD
ncbi:MAG: Segregation and condensation protein B [Gammaproteobacteria bacterium]|nr:Segregation and condensation protein B [Gammaproteobacteria bacterium]